MGVDFLDESLGESTRKLVTLRPALLLDVDRRSALDERFAASDIERVETELPGLWRFD